ncbi:MAG: hypothetical protein JWN40_1259 [Phycisphaerales bacterium]|nr:hypothetical protein [Phycisphaerales bacterium]
MLKRRPQPLRCCGENGEDAEYRDGEGLSPPEDREAVSWPRSSVRGSYNGDPSQAERVAARRMAKSPPTVILIPMERFDLFDAVRIARLQDGVDEMPAYHPRAETIRVGDVGVVIGNWLEGKYRVEAVDADGAIAWQDHFDPAQLERVEPTAAGFSRRRINDHWSCMLGMGVELFDPARARAALAFARKVMAFARRNVELLAERLERGGYRFAHPNGPWRRSGNDVTERVEQLARLDVHVPVAIHAWMLEVGDVDFCGTHPDWPRTGYVGMGDDGAESEPWYTDPLVVGFSIDDPEQAGEPRRLDIAPDVITKANVSGGAPVWVGTTSPTFDACLVGQSGSFTLLSYLRHAFAWGGFPGFEYQPKAPREMLAELARGLTRL